MNAAFRNLFHIHQATRPLEESEIVLEAVSFQARAPFGGLVWNRPLAVRVRGPVGETRLPIRDVTRRGQLLLYGLSLLFVLAGVAARGRSPQE